MLSIDILDSYNYILKSYFENKFFSNFVIGTKPLDIAKFALVSQSDKSFVFYWQMGIGVLSSFLVFYWQMGIDFLPSWSFESEHCQSKYSIFKAPWKQLETIRCVLCCPSALLQRHRFGQIESRNYLYRKLDVCTKLVTFVWCSH